MKVVKKRSRQPAVPIISLIDILAILLIFVILTHEPSEDRSHATITPPTASALATRTTSEARVELAITADAKLLLGADEVAPGELAARLRRLKADRPAAKLELKADEEAPLRMLVLAWDALTRAGFSVKDVPSRILLQKPDNSEPTE